MEKRTIYQGMPYPLITINELQIGSLVVIEEKQYKVFDYNNFFTKKFFEERRRRVLAIIKPDAYSFIGQIMERIISSGFYIKHLRSFKWNIEQAYDFYLEHIGKPYFDNLIKHASSGLSVGLELVSDNAVERWRKLMGPKNVGVARKTAPHRLRALYGTNFIKNALHGSHSPSRSLSEIEFVFGSETRYNTTATLKGCSCLFVKPHAMQAGNLGLIIGDIMDNGFKITAIEQITLSKTEANDFFKSYKDKSIEFVQMVNHVVSGPIVVMEVCKENAVDELRKIVGPNDPEEAVRVNPRSIR